MPPLDVYNEAVVTEIINRVSSGETLRAVLRDQEKQDVYPCRATFNKWVVEDKPKGMADRYARAREQQAESWADEVVELADFTQLGTVTTTKPDGGVEVKEGDMIDRARLRVDTRKWLMAKLHPRKYSERLAHTGPTGEGPVQVQWLDSQPKP